MKSLHTHTHTYSSKEEEEEREVGLQTLAVKSSEPVKSFVSPLPVK